MTDDVNHPAHYRAGGLECIDVIEALDLNYRLGNALKYLWRAGRKDKAKVVEDLRKATFYIEREIHRLSKSCESRPLTITVVMGAKLADSSPRDAARRARRKGK